MRLRRSQAGVWLSLLFVTVGCNPGEPRAEPNDGLRGVVLVTVDGIVPSELALYGGDAEMPNLAALAESGRAWSDVWTAVPMTLPAAATYLTGLAPDRHGVRDDLFTPLPGTTPTLATLLSDAGYRTAAFPNSSFLGFGSGLLGGFAVVDDPPGIPINPSRWIPLMDREADPAESFAVWLETLPAEATYFAWIHYPDPVVRRLEDQFISSRVRTGKPEDPDREPTAKELAQAEALSAPGRPDPVEQFDRSLGRVLAALDLRGDRESSLIAVAGTLGDAVGGEGELGGLGFSVGERAIRVPLVIDFPDGVKPARGPDEPVWAPDVSATIASVAGIALPAEAEGVDLLQGIAEDRVRFAWSWAPLDQLGWRALRAANSGAITRREGFDVVTEVAGGGDPGTEGERLGTALAGRRRFDSPRVPLVEVRSLLEGHDLEPGAASSDGRDFGTAASRLEIADRVWKARFLVQYGNMAAVRYLAQVLEADPENLAARLDRGQFQALRGMPGPAEETLKPALRLYGDNPEVLHWYAHSVWTEDREGAEKLLEAILPHKQHDGDVLYDLACMRSMAGDLEGSERYLRASIDAGYREWTHMEGDSDLRKLRESGRFAAVLREHRR